MSGSLECILFVMRDIRKCLSGSLDCRLFGQVALLRGQGVKYAFRYIIISGLF